jgi:hypothetical protein
MRAYCEQQHQRGRVREPPRLRAADSGAEAPTRFWVLVMSEESRLGREAIERAYVLKQLISAGVRVFFCMEHASARSAPPPTSC